MDAIEASNKFLPLPDLNAVRIAEFVELFVVMEKTVSNPTTVKFPRGACACSNHICEGFVECDRVVMAAKQLSNSDW
mgnify:CR=1 FL=1